MMTNGKTGVCTYVGVHNGREVRCTKSVGKNGQHDGDHEGTPGRPITPTVVTVPAVEPSRPAVETKAARGVPHPFGNDARLGNAYALGAIHYAVGLGLDRLARDIGAEPRQKHEADHDFSARLSKTIGATIDPGA